MAINSEESERNTAGSKVQDKALRFSIVVPVYNTEKYLAECIRSILAQSYGNFELILVDDGSTDSSRQICMEYAATDSRIRVIYQSNHGVSAARNAGLDASSGDYVTFTDSDDYLLEGALEYAAAKIQATGADMLAFGIRKITPYKSFHYRAVPDKTGPLEGHMPHLAIGGSFFRLSALNLHDIRFTEGLAYSEDRVFILSFAPYCRQLTTCSEVFYIYRSNDGAATCSRTGLRIMKNQFRAARIMFNMSKESLYAGFSKQLQGQARKVIKWGIHAVVRYNPDSNSIFITRQEFLKQFSGEYRHPACAWTKLLATRRFIVLRESVTRFFRGHAED